MIVNTENLKYALNIVGNTYNRNVHQPVLKSVLFEVTGDRVAISTTDLVGTSQVVIPCVSKNDSSFLVEYERVRDFVKLVVADTVEFKIGAKVLLTAEGYPKLSLSTTDIKLFPKIQKPDSVDFRLSLAELYAAISCGDFVDLQTVPLNGIHVSQKMVEATDRYIGKRTFGDFNFPDMVLPASIARMVSLFKNEDVGVFVDKSSISLVGNAWFFRYLRLSGKYPDTGVAYNNSNQTVLEMDKSELELILSALKVAGDVLTINVDYDTITFNVSGETSTSHSIKLQKTYTPNEFVVSIPWFTKILKSCEEDIVTVYVGERRQPIIIEDGENTQFFMLQWNI